MPYAVYCMSKVRKATPIPIYIQQDAKLHSLFISGNCSTCFGWYFHPSSGAHTTVSTASGIYQTVIANCCYRERVWTAVPTLPWTRQVAITVWQVQDAVDTVVCAPDDGWRYRPKYLEQFPDINKLWNVASCWIYIGIYLRYTDPCTLKQHLLPISYFELLLV